MKQTKVALILFSCVIGFALASCSSNSDKSAKKQLSPEDLLLSPAMDYTADDSAKINALVEQFTEGLKTQNYADCAQLLHKVVDGEVVAYSAEEKQQYVQAMSSFRRIFDVRTTGFILRSDKNNNVKLTLQIQENGNISENIGTISMSLNPVYKDGEWYLTLYDKYAEGVEDIYAREK